MIETLEKYTESLREVANTMTENMATYRDVQSGLDKLSDPQSIINRTEKADVALSDLQANVETLNELTTALKEYVADEKEKNELEEDDE